MDDVGRQEGLAMYPSMNPAREASESFEAYRDRCRLNNEALRAYLKGRFVWVSTYQGTYRRPKEEAHG